MADLVGIQARDLPLSVDKGLPCTVSLVLVGNLV